jgi:predicted nuclease of restriction endonuclease-like (RecB) superfamily
MADRLSSMPAGYDAFLRDLKERIRAAQVRAALAVNRELVLLYWRIGRDILRQQAAQGWGARVIDRLADDLRRAFPEMKGFSPRNLKYMRAFAQTYPDEAFVQQVAAQIPWFHNCMLLDVVLHRSARRDFAAQRVVEGLPAADQARSSCAHEDDGRDRRGIAVEVRRGTTAMET